MLKLRLLYLLIFLQFKPISSEKRDLEGWQTEYGLLSPNVYTEYYYNLLDIKDYEDYHFIMTSGQLFKQTDTLELDLPVIQFVDYDLKIFSFPKKAALANYMTHYIIAGCSKEFFLELFETGGVSKGFLYEYQGINVGSDQLNYNLIDRCSMSLRTGDSTTVFLANSIKENGQMKYLVALKAVLIRDAFMGDIEVKRSDLIKANINTFAERLIFLDCLAWKFPHESHCLSYSRV